MNDNNHDFKFVMVYLNMSMAVLCYIICVSPPPSSSMCVRMHCAFFSAVLLSGLEQKNIPYSPYSVKRALENTAFCLDTVDSFVQGHGLLQVRMIPSVGLSLPCLC